MNRPRKFSATIFALPVLFTFQPTLAEAKLKLKIKDVLKLAPALILPAPTIAYDLIKKDNPIDRAEPVKAAVAEVIDKTSDVYQKVQDKIYKYPRDAIKSTLGDDWVTAFNILTASQRIQYEAATTGGKFLAKCLGEGQCSPTDIVAIPLAAGLKDAYKAYIDKAQPIDSTVAHWLSHAAPGSTVTSARWTVAKTPDFTLPGFLNAGYEAFGNGHAVTIGNLIIFSRKPDFETHADVIWVLHELSHVEQYANFSGDPLEAIDGFAVEYVSHYKRLEDEAQSKAVERAKLLPEIE